MLSILDKFSSIFKIVHHCHYFHNFPPFFLMPLYFMVFQNASLFFDNFNQFSCPAIFSFLVRLKCCSSEIPRAFYVCSLDRDIFPDPGCYFLVSICFEFAPFQDAAAGTTKH